DSDNDGIPDAVEKGTGTTPLDTDGDGIPDYRDTDSDNDGILDSVEKGTGTTPLDTDGDGTPDFQDTDSDNDGIPDSVEKGTGTTPLDTDGDGTPDFQDTDSDNDGIPDAVEKGTGTTPLDTDGDGIPDYRDTDSDNDGILDSVEKGTGTTPLDTDGDGTPDFQDTDSDGDGVLDNVDQCVTIAGPASNNGCPADFDGDGIDDVIDLDDDNDGILDTVEAAACTPTDPNCDTDGDGIPNRLDSDSDGDGISDVTEAGGTDTNGDGKVDGGVDANGVPLSTNGGLTPPNTDGTGAANPYDVDSDGDGIPDSIEKGTGTTPVDTDGDGTPDYLDTDSDGDGIPDSVEKGTGTTPVDTDGDGTPDYLDTDSDNDGILDSVEKGTGTTPLDTDGDGIPDYRDTDSDNDGIPDSVEKGTGTTPLDTDGDGIPDYRDTDSDGDGIPDSVEKGTGTTPLDTDGDGIPDYRDTDSDNDGIPDAVEKGTGTTPLDTDGDGIPDYRDTDSDGDGILDSVEKGTGTTPADTDGDGIPDYRDLDSDGDGVTDAQEVIDGTSSVDPCAFVSTHQTLTPSAAWSSADCDGDGQSNATEITNGTDPLVKCSNTISFPTPTITSSGSSVCAGSAVTLTASTASSYTWYKGGVLIPGATAQTLVTYDAGSYSLKVKNALGCESTLSASEVVAVSSPPTASIAQGALLAMGSSCNGTPIKLEVSSNAVSGATYQWYKDGVILTGETNAIYNATSAGSYTVKVNNGVCTTESAVTKILPPASASTTLAPTVCAGEIITISADPTGYTNPTYQWEMNTGSGWVNVPSNGTSVNYDAAVSGQYRVNITSSSVTSTSCPIDITINALPTVTLAVAPSASVCAGTPSTITATPVGASPFTYKWRTGGVEMSTQTASSFSTSTSGTFDVKVTDTNGCSAISSQSTITVNVIPAQVAASITQPTCTTNTGTITVTSPQETGMTYSIDGVNYTNTSGIFTGVAPGTYSVTAKNASGCISTATSVTVSPVPTAPAMPGTITGNTHPNIASTSNYAISAVSGAVSYIWTLPSTWTGSSVTTSINAVVGTVSGNVSVQSVGANGCVSSPKTLAIIVEMPQIDPDFNNGLINKPIAGSLATNDEIVGGATYGSPVATGTNPTGATFTVNSDGTYSFTATQSGVYTYNVPVCPAGQTTGCPLSPVSFTVVDPLASNVAPAVNPDISTVKDGSSVTTNVMANDICENPNCSLSNPTIATQPAHGTVTVNSDGTLTYTPTPGYVGTDVLTYQVCDNSVNPAVCKTASVTYTVEPTNASPTTTAADDAVRTAGNFPATGNVLSNDGTTNPSAVLTVTSQTTTIPNKGTIVMNADGTYTFTPLAGFTGTLDIPYTVCDNATPANCSSASLHVVVEPAAPVIQPDFNAGLINSPIAGRLASNDVIVGDGTYGSPVALGSNPTGATMTVNANGTYNFQATQPGVYTYNVPVCPSGQTTNCPLSPITITVTDPYETNVAPTVNPDAAIVKSGSSVTTNVLANDICQNDNCNLNPSSVAVTVNPAHGTVTVNSDGTLTYTPTPGYVGTDVLTYKVCDDATPTPNCKTATVTYTVDPANAPARTVAADDFITTSNMYPAYGNVLTNDVNSGGLPLTVTSAASVPANIGTLVMNADGSYTFTPAVGFTGSYDAVYTVCDNATPAHCVNATLHLVVEPAPNFVSDINATNISVPVSGDVSTNDNSTGTIYGTPVAASTNPSGGTITMNSDGTYDFEAATPGKYVFDVPNCLPGQTSGCATTQLVITVKDPNSLTIPPVVNPDVATVKLGADVTTNILANDKCSNQGCSLDPTSVSIVVEPSHGTIVVNSDGTLTYTPEPGFVGTDEVTYRVCDNSNPALCSSATVTYTVLASDALTTTAPADDYASTKGNAQVTGNVLDNDGSTNPNAVSRVTANGSIPSTTGTLVINPDGTYTFTPANGFVGSVDVPYTVCDNETPANCADATLHIVVDPAPTATNDVISEATNGVFTANILANDQIQPGTGISITRQSGAGAGTAQGTVTFDALTGAINYVPSVLDGNSVTIGYTVCDNNYTPSQCAIATVTITVCDPANPAMDCDGDGVTNGQEVLDNTDPADSCSMKATSQTLTPNSLWMAADCDGDGVTNGKEKLDGTDPVDPCSLVVASQTLTPSIAWLAADCDGDGTPNNTDSDPLNFCVGGSGTIPTPGTAAYEAYAAADCDNDGIPNMMECFGAIGNCQDFDGDGVPNYMDTDSDGDGITDAVEKNIDTDKDGDANYLDLDSDNDGISDKCEGITDTDSDGIPNYLDLDSDNDGILDAWEAVPVYAWHNDANFDGTLTELADANNNGWADMAEARTTDVCGADTDGDGIPDRLDTDSDNDCIPDSIEFTSDPDKDNRPSYRDTDADGDGIPDNIEAGSNCAKPVDTDGDGIPDYLDLDSDNDGIPDSVEKGPNGASPLDTDGDGTPDFRDLDSDNDGILDSVEKGPNGASPLDTDGDGIPDYRDLDSDGDGISDKVEAGANPAVPVDTDKDGIPDYLDVDSDNDGIPDSVEKGPNGATPVDTDNDGIPDYLDVDSDNDGIPDSVEAGANGASPLDTDGDGIPDYRDLDSDNDGIPDSVEKGPNGASPLDTDGDGIPDYRDTDSDNDGILDKLESGANPANPVDTDGDGIPDYLDLDSDNDGIPDSVEVGANPASPVDTDGDGIPDFRDLDSDNDGIPDAIEAGKNPLTPLDTDGDGIPDFRDLDSDGDGMLDAKEAGPDPLHPIDSDKDGIPNFQDADSDNDGIPDIIEIGGDPNKPKDTDGDGIPDYLDLDADNDGIPDSVEKGPNGASPLDTDGDGIPDYLDLDSDNDGIPDAVEVGKNPAVPVDTDGDGIPDYRDLDSDNDGVPDAVEAGKNPAKPVDSDGDGIPDYQDIDSDNDGIPDKVEAGKSPAVPVDTDKDGTPDYLDLDSDNDGIPDSVEKGPNGATPIDTDGDGIPDYLDLDSDNDGIPDAVEAGKNPAKPVDTDGDGIPDYRDLDSDNDGIPDKVEAGANPAVPVDTDKDGIPDYQDLDSDNDGISDKVEKGADGNNPVDTDKDGIPDYRDLDSDNDGFSDAMEKGADGNNPIDTDKDGIPDYRDVDSDNDGLADKLEDDLNFGAIEDCDKDGIPNRLDTDTCETFIAQGISPNGDGINDVLIIPGIMGTKNRITIYNRWGNIVFETENYQNNWGGETNKAYELLAEDGKLPDGTYYYIVDFYGAKPTVGTYVFVNRTVK
ncbi:Ig-like domain-containing protein, partial [Aquirufa sp. ROCK-SH2]